MSTHRTEHRLGQIDFGVEIASTAGGSATFHFDDLALATDSFAPSVALDFCLTHFGVITH